MSGLFIGLLALGSVLLSLRSIKRDRAPGWQFAMPRRSPSAGAPHFTQVFDYTPPEGVAHAPGVVVQDGKVQILWFEGSAEAQPDVDIHAAELHRDGQGWRASDPARLFTGPELGLSMTPGQLVITLGNTIENEGLRGGLYATVVSIGGWAMASVAALRMQGGRITQARKLNLSPFLNRSHLVKSPMVAYADGSHALPAYFEMGVSHGVLVRTGADGRVRDTRRLWGRGVKAIQPMIVPLDAQRAVAFLRDFDPSGCLWISHTRDGGQSWSDVARTAIPNPSAPVAALALSNGQILMAMNDEADRADHLRLALSDDEGRSWRVFHTLSHEGGDARYPMLRHLPGGEILLAYSHSTKRGIRAVVFNEPWVMAQ